MSDTSSDIKIGFQLEPDAFEEVGFVLVKASALDVAEYLARLRKTKVKTDVWGKTLKVDGILLFQPKDSEWTTFQYFTGEDQLPLRLSRELSTQVIYYYHEDTSGWTYFTLFDQGNKVEAFAFGTDYTQEFGEFISQEEEAAEDNTSEWEYDIRENGIQTLFLSRRRSVSAADLSDKEEFLDSCFRISQAWLPPADYIPNPTGRCEAKEARAEDFSGIHFVPG